MLPPCHFGRAVFALFVGNVLHDVAHITVQNAAEHFNGVGADTFISLQAGDLTGAYMVLLDERILTDAFCSH